MILFWCVLWILVGTWTGVQIHQLTGLTDSTVQSGRALQTAGAALRSVSSVPVIGDRTGELGQQVSATADGIIASGGDARASVQRLSILIGLAVGLGPCAPVLLGYIPLRISRRNDVRDVRRALAADPNSPALQRFLMERALVNLRFRELVEVRLEPGGGVADDQHERLATAELHRLGLRWSDHGTT